MNEVKRKEKGIPIEFKVTYTKLGLPRSFKVVSTSALGAILATIKAKNLEKGAIYRVEEFDTAHNEWHKVFGI